MVKEDIEAPKDVINH